MDAPAQAFVPAPARVPDAYMPGAGYGTHFTGVDTPVDVVPTPTPAAPTAVDPAPPAKGSTARFMREFSERQRLNREAVAARVKRMPAPAGRQAGCCRGGGAGTCCTGRTSTLWEAMGCQIVTVTVVVTLTAGIWLTVAGVNGDGDGYLIAGISVLALFGLPCACGVLYWVGICLAVLGGWWVNRHNGR